MKAQRAIHQARGVFQCRLMKQILKHETRLILRDTHLTTSPPAGGFVVCPLSRGCEKIVYQKILI